MEFKVPAVIMRAIRRQLVGNVVYTAGPLQAFLGSLGTIGLLLGLGVLGIGAAALIRNQGAGARIALGGAGTILLLAGAGMAVVTLASASAGTRVVSLTLDNKRLAEYNCGNNGETCERYVLEVTTSQVAYDFSVPKAAYDQAQVGVCYQFTYYPNQGLFSSVTAPYEMIDRVARIETADPSTCP